jgi:hypothetical protein
MSQGINTGTSVSADQIERIVREVLASLSVANSTIQTVAIQTYCI